MERLEQLRESGLFSSRVPRYTSYPPANRFISDEGGLHQNQWLSAIPHDASLSAYIHIPYCHELCWFCACRTQAAESIDAIGRYVDVLLREIAQVRKKLPASVSLSRLYLGGGTPTMMLPAQMKKLLDAIYAAIPPAPGFEFFVEVDTTNVSPAVIDSLLHHGMTRALVGVQDFDINVQNAIGRRQSFEQTLDVVRQMRATGLQNLDMEMLYGLPRQTVRSIADTAQQVLALDPDRLAVCEYSHIPNVAKRQMMIDARYLPTSEQAFVMSQTAHQILISDGYKAVGIDHFTRPGDRLIAARDNGTLRRDFQGYSDNASHSLIGFGTSAISRFPQGYVQNASATSVYTNHIRNGRLAGDRGYDLTATDQLVAFMIEMLMCRFELATDAVRERFPSGRDFVAKAIDKLSRTFEPFLEVSPERLIIKPVAYPTARLICNALDQMGRDEATA